MLDPHHVHLLYTTDTPTVPVVHGAPDASKRRSARCPYTWAQRALVIALAALAYLPPLLVERSVVASDTKTYLYLDPLRFLSQVATMWNPGVALGTTTHEYVGYLFPMGPFFALGHLSHLPIWVTQRLWLATIVLLAGLGASWCARVFRVDVIPQGVAAVLYMLSPYVLQYSGRISVLLLPYAALPWLVGIAQRAMQRQIWRYPALFALLVAASSGINASSILYVLAGPVLVALIAVITKEASWRVVGSFVMRSAILTATVCAWWVVALFIEAGYGVDVLKYTESVRATSTTDSPAEVFRGLGYWYFYGRGRTGPWNPVAVSYMRSTWLLVASFTAPLVATLAGLLAPRRLRTVGLALLAVGLVLSVGAYPYQHPSILGRWVKALMLHTTVGLAMRSTDRATPLVVLGIALLAAGGIDALRQRAQRPAIVVALGVVALVVMANPAYFDGRAEVVAGQTQPASLPNYQLAAAHYLDSHRTSTRVAAIPGNNFAAYTFGDTIDTPQPALLTRPFVTREQQVMGSQATADLLYGLDSPLQTSTSNSSALAPMARLMSAGDLLVEYDQTATRYGVVQPRTLALALRSLPLGLSQPRSFGPLLNAPTAVSRSSLASTRVQARPHRLVDYVVSDPRPLLRAESVEDSLVVDGDGAALTTLAGQGLLNSNAAIYFAGTLDRTPAKEKALARHGATLVLTDTNAKQAFQWNSLSANTGYVLSSTQQPNSSTVTDYPIALFPGTSSSAQSVATYVGARSISASSYGNPLNYTPELQPAAAIDGLVTTAWETGAYSPRVRYQWWEADFYKPVRLSSIRLLQPQTGTRSRWITAVTIALGHGRRVHVHLDARSRHGGGQLIAFSPTNATFVRITIASTAGKHGSPGPATPVGFANIELSGHPLAQSIRLPTDLLGRLGVRSARDRLIVSLARQRVGATSPRRDPQPYLARTFTIPTARTFAFDATASLSSRSNDPQVDTALGRVLGGVVATSSSRLPGDLGATASATLDHSNTTWWQSDLGRGHVEDAWLSYTLPSSFTGGTVAIEEVDDHRHSVAREVTIDLEDPTGRVLSTYQLNPTLPRTLASHASSYITTSASLPASEATRVVVHFSDVEIRRNRTTTTDKVVALPLAIASVSLPGTNASSTPALVADGCRNDLLSIDQRPIWVSIEGSTQSALAGHTLAVVGCGPDANGIELAAGTHSVVTNPAIDGALSDVACAPVTCNTWNINDLTFASAPGGGPTALGASPPGAPAGSATLAPSHPPPSPRLDSTAFGATSMTASLSDIHGPFELVLGESINSGWRAIASTVHDRHQVTLGSPSLVDGFANGWYLTAPQLRSLGIITTSGSIQVALRWLPQRNEDIALLITIVGTLGCLFLIAFTGRRRRRLWLDSSIGADHPAMLPPAPFRGGRHVLFESAAAGGLATLILSPWWGFGAFALWLLVSRTKRRPTFASLGSAALLLAALGYVVAHHIGTHVIAGSGWPLGYAPAGTLVLAAVGLALIDLLAPKDRIDVAD